MKKVRMGCTEAYYSFGLLIEASLMRRYHNKLEGVANTKVQRHITPTEVMYPSLSLGESWIVELYTEVDT